MKLLMWLRRIWFLLHGELNRSRTEAEMSAEMEFHIESRTADLLARNRNLSHEAARRQARLEFGALEKYKEEGREAAGFHLLNETRGDFRYALRQLRKSPIFTASVVLILAIGIGTTSAAFNIVNALLLKPLPVTHPEQLLQLEWSAPRGDFVKSISLGGNDHLPGLYTSFSYPAYAYLRDRASSFSDLICFDKGKSLNINTGHSVVMASGQLVSGNFFDGFGARAFLGRNLEPSDEKREGDWPVVASYTFWQREFGADPLAIGQTITINGSGAVLVGVMGPEFRGPIPIMTADLFMPVTMQAIAMVTSQDFLKDPHWWSLLVFGRLRTSIRTAQAQAEIDTLLRQEVAGEGVPPEQLPRATVASASHGIALISQIGLPIASLLLLAVGLVLLVAMSNLAGMVLARGSARGAEIGTRLALGAARRRIVRQLLTENVLLSLLGGTLGIVVVYSVRALLETALGYLPAELGLQVDAAPDWRVFMFAVSISIIVGVLFGLSPALSATRVDLLSILKLGPSGCGMKPSGNRLRSVLIATQVAISLTLLASAGLVLQTVSHLQVQPLGFDADSVITFRTDPSRNGYKGPRILNFYEEATHRIEALPGVQSVSVAAYPALSFGSSSAALSVDGYTPQSKSSSEAFLNLIAPRFFESMGIPLIAGRDLRWSDVQEAPGVVLVNEALVRQFFNGRNPVGADVRTNKGGDVIHWTVVGVVKDAQFNVIRSAPPPTIYFSYRQNSWVGAMTFLVRTTGEPRLAIPMLRKAMSDIDRNVPATLFKTEREFADLQTLPQRTLGVLLIALALTVVAMACAGIYGTLTYTASRRTAEFGIRMALGARQQEIIRINLNQLLAPVAIGIALGSAGAVAAGYLIQGLLFGVRPTDPFSIFGSAAVLLVTAALAAFVPARRACRSDPMVALRYE